MSDYKQINTPMFRGAFVNVIEPKKVEKKDKKTGQKVEVDSYGLTMLFADDENLDDIKAAATELMKEKFGDKKNWPKPFHAENNPNGYKTPWRKQWEKCSENEHIDKSYDGFSKKGLFMNCKTQQRPEVVDRKRKEIVDGSQVYSGAYYIANVDLFWYDNESKGIGVSLNVLMKVKEGDQLGGSSITAAEAFEGIEIDDDEDASSVFDDEEDDDEDDPFA